MFNPISHYAGWPTALILVCTSFIILRLASIAKRDPGLPPGPPTIPILGNLAAIPRERAYLKFTEWAKQYGGIYSLKILSRTVIVLTDPAAVHELLEKRSSSTSDRGASFIGDSVTSGMHLAGARYGKTWRLLRRCANEILSPIQSNKHLPIQRAETAQLLHDLLKTPEDFYRHVGRFSNSIIMSVVYGIRSPLYDTQHAMDFYEMEDRWLTLMDPAAHLAVTLIPILRYMPDRWASWKAESREVRRLQSTLFFDLLSQSEARLGRGEENGSFIESVLERQENLQLSRDQIAYLGGVMIEGGSETTTSFLRTLVLALVEHPEVVRKAREEIDKVVGDSRAPDIEDAAHLPYIHAIVKETYRFRPMLPLAIEHGFVSDEMYLTYCIPKGTIAFINLWGIFHDPDIFDKPETFWPDRYILSEHGTKPSYEAAVDPRATLVFGAGRRMCPGLYVANNTLLLAVMNLTWAFDFERPLDPIGQPLVPLDMDNFSSRVTIAPKPFMCRIIPSSQKKAALIEANFTDALETLAKFERGLEASGGQ